MEKRNISWKEVKLSCADPLPETDIEDTTFMQLSIGDPGTEVSLA